MSSDRFADETLERCLWAVKNNRRQPSDGWPERERLAVAIVLMSKTYLDQHGYTVSSAHRRLFESMTLTATQFSAWVESVRRRLAKADLEEVAAEDRDQCSDCGEFTDDLYTQPPVTTPYWVCRDCHIARYGVHPPANGVIDA